MIDFTVESWGVFSAIISICVEMENGPAPGDSRSEQVSCSSKIDYTNVLTNLECVMINYY